MVLLIDNYDSFTYNLVDYITQLGKTCKVIRNDELSIKEISLLDIESIVISPGPCTPNESGVTTAIIKEYYKTKPILGICLGHQALGQFFGAKLEKAIQPIHGKVSTIQVDTKSPLFTNLPTQIDVMRYHSLILRDVIEPLQIIAQTPQDEIMAVMHESLPLAGLQFHPESILSKDGLKILKNWFEYLDIRSSEII